VAPGAIIRAAELSVDEAVDALMADNGHVLLTGEPSRYLFWRPTAFEMIQHKRAQDIVAFEPRAVPAARPGLLFGISWPVADLNAAIALQLARYARRRAIQSCSDLPDRLPVFAKTGNRAPLLKCKLLVVLSHPNTLTRCCTSFVNLGNPFLAFARADEWIPA
jgi:hypothetical protein